VAVGFTGLYRSLLVSARRFWMGVGIPTIAFRALGHITTFLRALTMEVKEGEADTSDDVVQEGLATRCIKGLQRNSALILVIR